MAKTLLLADDSVTIQKVVGISLASEDVNLVTVDNGDDALTRARELRPDAVLADVVMPGKNGYEVCEALRADPQLRHIPVLLLTGTFEAFDEERAERCGAAGHIAKPFEAQTLVEEVRRLLERGAATPAAAGAAQAPTPMSPRVPQAPTAPAPPREARAPTPAPPPEGSSAVGDSFEFFDDGLDELTPAEPADGAATVSIDLDLDESDTAFAFGGDDLGSEDPLFEGGGPDRTVALLPDDASATGGDPLLDPAALTRLEEPGPAADLDLAEPLDGGDGTDLFSMELEAGGGGESLGGEDLSQTTIVDAASVASFDISAADLEPAAEAATGADVLDVSLAPGSEPPRPSFEPIPEPSADRFAEPSPAPEAWGAAAAVGARGAASPALPSEDDDAESTALAESAVAAISPRLRRQLHETLEKVAWESLSDVTEQIVRHAVERVEAIAWEVIPQMAETLIREEIRKLKGEPGES